MDEHFVTPLLAGPLLILGLMQLFAVKKLFSWQSVQIFLWGLLFAIAAVPVLVLVGAVDIAPGREMLFELGGRMVRIWLSIYGLAVVGRWGVAIAQWIWRRRPRPNHYDPGAGTDIG